MKEKSSALSNYKKGNDQVLDKAQICVLKDHPGPAHRRAQRGLSKKV